MSTTNSDPALAASQQFEVVNAHDIEEPEITEAAPEDHPTDSHELANADHEEKGASQIEHGHTEVRDLGWNDNVTDVPTPLVGGLQNEDLWILIRRFNKVGEATGRFRSKGNAKNSVANVPCQSPS